MNPVNNGRPGWPQPEIESACQQPLHPQAIRGIELFNLGEYFAAHEALETAWRAEPGPRRELYRAILLAGVAFLHVQRNNAPGAGKVAKRCLRWLESLPPTCCGVRLEGLRLDMTRLSLWLDSILGEKVNLTAAPLVQAIQFDLHWPVEILPPSPIEE